MDMPPLPFIEDKPAIVQQMERPTPLTHACLNDVSEKYGIHPVVLSLIYRVEGGKSGYKIQNKDKTHDLGLMQINWERHQKKLEKRGITENMVRYNDCLNLAVAAHYVREVTHGIRISTPREYFRAIARYHNKGEPFITVYTDKLIAAYKIMLREYSVQHSSSDTLASK